jgi:hypothetical protein
MIPSAECHELREALRNVWASVTLIHGFEAILRIRREIAGKGATELVGCWLLDAP